MAIKIIEILICYNMGKLQKYVKPVINNLYDSVYVGNFQKTTLLSRLMVTQGRKKLAREMGGLLYSMKNFFCGIVKYSKFRLWFWLCKCVNILKLFSCIL